MTTRGTTPRESKGHPPQNRPEGPGVAEQGEPATHDGIARRAYELYLERGGQDGHDVEDWLRAEAELAPGRG